MIKPLQSGRDAFDRHDWATAVERLNSVDRETRLAAEDLERLGTARWWVGQLDEATDAFERAFAAYQQAGRPTDAARTALELAYRAFRGLASPIAASWLAQAGRLLAGAPESGSHAWLGVFNTIGAFEAQDIDQAIASADEAMAIARRQDEPGALFVAMSFKGSAELQKGHVEAGLALIDEAAASVSSGRLDVRVASDIYCNTIAACRNVGDLGRAGQWADEGERWMRRNGAGGYPGICRVHRAELKMLRGDWLGAEQEARQACDELQRFRLLDVIGYAQYEIGEVRLRMGDLDGAAEAFDKAYEAGHDAQPGLARLQLARGDSRS
jgi:tetratricopeptide (TPR) repeat protein